MVYTLLCWTLAGPSLDKRWSIAGHSLDKTRTHSRPPGRRCSEKDSDRQGHMATDTTFRRVMAQPKKSGHGGRTEAYAWLRVRFEKLSPRFRNRPGWRGIAEELAAGGIKGGNGRPLTARAVMRIWPRVCQDVAAEEPWRVTAVRVAMQEGEVAQHLRRRESERGKDVDRPPPVVTASMPLPPVPHYPPPQTMPAQPVQGMLVHRPHSELSEEERKALAHDKTLRLRRVIAQASGRDPNEIT